MLKKTCLIVVLPFLFITHLFAADFDPADNQGRFVYSDPSYNRSEGELGNLYLINDQQEPRYFIGDIGYSARDCSDKKFHCFSSQAFYLAIPRKLSEKSGEWRSDGVSFQLSESRMLSVLGMERYVYFIDSSFNDQRFRFIYSKKHGLLGIGIVKDDNIDRLFFLTTSCGFAASKSCS